MSEPSQPEARAVSGASNESAAARRPSAGVAAWPSLAALALALAALALAAWQGYHSRAEIGMLRGAVAKKLADGDARDRESRAIAEQLREAVADAQSKLAALESRLAESQSQQIALESLYQELSRNRDEWAYAEIEQSLFIASQQLALAGNVKGALIALQAADARLQGMDRPQLAALRKALHRDIERLKAAPHADLVAISARLDGLIARADSLPLAMDARPQPPAPAAAPPEAPASVWTRIWRDAWAELKDLVRIQRVDTAEPALLAPEQAYFLRENLKLRLAGARLALLARDAASYRADLEAARAWLGRYYDARHGGVTQALAALRALQDAEVGIEAPDIAATLAAMQSLREARERGAGAPAR